MEVNRYHRKPEERRNEHESNNIYTEDFLLITRTGKMIIRAHVRQTEREGENGCNLTEENRFVYICQINEDHWINDGIYFVVNRRILSRRTNTPCLSGH